SPAHAWQDAKLRDVSGSIRDQARQTNAANSAGSRVYRHQRSLGREMAATGELNNVRQEMAGAGDRPVLIVDLAIDVPAIGSGNKLGGLLAEAIGPGEKADTQGWVFRLERYDGLARDPHEVAVVAFQ